eukprot:6476389-Amphidinium_carterae.2
MSRGKGISVKDAALPEVLDLLLCLAKSRETTESFTSIQLNELREGQRIKEHHDEKNEGGSWLISWGGFTGGELEVLEGETWKKIDTRHTWYKMSDHTKHRVKRVISGVRYSAVFYTPKGALDGSCRQLLRELQTAGYPAEDRVGCNEVERQRSQQETWKHENVSHEYLSEDLGCTALPPCPALRATESAQSHDQTKGKEQKKEKETKIGSKTEDKEEEVHRDLNAAPCGPLLSACVVRQIQPSEAEFRSPGCRKALQDEVDKLREKGTWESSWDEDDVMELSALKQYPELRIEGGYDRQRLHHHGGEAR